MPVGVGGVLHLGVVKVVGVIAQRPYIQTEHASAFVIFLIPVDRRGRYEPLLRDNPPAFERPLANLLHEERLFFHVVEIGRLLLFRLDVRLLDFQLRVSAAP